MVVMMAVVVLLHRANDIIMYLDTKRIGNSKGFKIENQERRKRGAVARSEE